MSDETKKPSAARQLLAAAGVHIPEQPAAQRAPWKPRPGGVIEKLGGLHAPRHVPFDEHRGGAKPLSEQEQHAAAIKAELERAKNEPGAVKKHVREGATLEAARELAQLDEKIARAAAGRAAYAKWERMAPGSIERDLFERMHAEEIAAGRAALGIKGGA